MSLEIISKDHECLCAACNDIIPSNIMHAGCTALTPTAVEIFLCFSCIDRASVKLLIVNNEHNMVKPGSIN